jgi:hypothetical protein
MSTQLRRACLWCFFGAGLLLCARPGAAEGQASAPSSVDSVPGQWKLEITTSETIFACTLNLSAKSAKLSGTLDCPQGRVDVEGRTDANHFAIGFQIVTGDSIFYEGTVARDSVSGSWREPGSNGTFRGSRDSRNPFKTSTVRDVWRSVALSFPLNSNSTKRGAK